MKTLIQFNSCLVAGLLLAGVAGCGKQPAEKPTIEGRWSGFERGSTEKITVTFNAGHFAYSDAQSNEVGSGTFVINDTVQPMQMDMTFEKIPAPDYVGKVSLTVFELQNDELKIAGSEPGSAQRPASIAGGQGVRVFTFTRE